MHHNEFATFEDRTHSTSYESNDATPSAMTTTQEDQISLEGESSEAKIERLGRQRPHKLVSAWQEVGFVLSIAVSQLINEYFVSGFTLLLPTVAEALQIPSSSSTWPASAFSLVISSFLLPFGRIAGELRRSYYIGEATDTL